MVARDRQRTSGKRSRGKTGQGASDNQCTKCGNVLSRIGCRCEESEPASKNLLPSDPVGQRTRNECKNGCRQGIACDDDSRLSGRYIEFASDGRQEWRHQLRVRDSKEENAEKDERYLPVERFAAGHARILAHA